MLPIFIYLVSFLFMSVLGMEVNAHRSMEYWFYERR